MMIMVNRMKAARVALLIGLGAALHPAPAVSAEQSATELKVIPLRTVDNQGGQLELRGQAGQLQFRVPVEAGAKVRDARLRLVYQSADAVRSERSRMWVYLNQQSIAQLPLSSGGDAVRADIVLPPDLLTTGHNTLSLWAQQEGSRGCDADSSAALWTRLDPGNSYLALETAGPDRERNLADLADPTSFIGAGSERIELLTPTAPTEGALKAGALVAQGFALRMPDSRIAVRHRLADPKSLAGRNGKVVVGTADKIRSIAGLGGLTGDLPDVQGPYIGLRPIQGAGPVLIVSGRTDVEVLKAASAFADPSVALPAATDWTVDAVRSAVPWNRTMQEPGRSYRFKELRAISGGISNGTEARIGLELNLPADTLPAGGRKVLLELDYTYAQNLAPNSVVNVLVNGNYASMIALNDPRGETVGKHRVLLPIDRFRPGMNTIAFEPMIGSDSATGCLVRPGAGRSIAISGDSTITIPDMARVASLPDLQLFASGGFPYVGTTDPRAGSQRNFEVLLTGMDSGTIGGAWTLLAKLAQTAGHPIANFAIGPTAGYRGDVLMIGPADSLDGRIAADLPPAARHVHDAIRPAGSMFQPGSGLQSSLQPGLLPDPASVQVSPSVIKASIADAKLVAQAVEWSSRMSRTFRETLWPGRHARTGATNLSQIGEGSAMMAAFESPVKPQSTITVITANSGEDVEAGIASLVRPALWDRLSGGTVAWDAASMLMQAWPAEDNYRMGDIPNDWHQRILFINAVSARNPVAWALLALAGLFVLSGLTHVALNKRQGS
jgi:cellulose synthase operon protein B